jgi:glycosyltransferase involved in cell wall biosynthesis
VDVSIVIPAYNSSRILPDCLAACVSQDFSGDYEIVVVDDGSTDDTAIVAGRFGVRYIHQANAGPAAARNAGWKAASGRVVCFTDADCVPEREWIRKMSDSFSASGADAVGGSYSFSGNDWLGKIVHAEIETRHGKMGGAADFLGSFNLAVKRAPLTEIAGFNEAYRYASGEDNDLCYRLKRAGFTLHFDRSITVGHRHAWTLWTYLRSQARHGYWRMKLYRDHPHMARGDQYAGVRDFALPPLSVCAVVLFVMRWTTGYMVSLAVLAALAFRLDPRLWTLVFVRSFFRGFGMLFGAIRFMIK